MKETRKEAVGGLLSGIDLDGLAAGAEGGARHPLGEEFGYEVSENLYLMDPGKIVLEGPYVREWLEEDEAFRAFCEAVRESGEIEQPIGIRTAGSLLEKRYVLVYGMRRWKAARAAGLTKIPVRDYGEISEEASVALQMLENEARADPHPVDTAYGYHLLVAQGKKQVEVARAHGKTPAYVSYMRAVGEAIAALSAEERARLYRAPEVTVRAFQEIAKLPSAAARREALLRLAGAGPSEAARAVGRRRAREGHPFHTRALRGGRSFRVRWKEEDLRGDPAGFVEAFHRHITAEYQHLAERLRVLERQRKTGDARAPEAEALRRAIGHLEGVLAEMERRESGGAGGGAEA